MYRFAGWTIWRSIENKNPTNTQLFNRLIRCKLDTQNRPSNFSEFDQLLNNAANLDKQHQHMMSETCIFEQQVPVWNYKEQMKNPKTCSKAG